MGRFDIVLEKAKEHHLTSKLPIRKCIELALEEVIGNEDISLICSNYGAMKKDLIDFLVIKYGEKYGI